MMSLFMAAKGLHASQFATSPMKCPHLRDSLILNILRRIESYKNIIAWLIITVWLYFFREFHVWYRDIRPWSQEINDICFGYELNTYIALIHFTNSLKCQAGIVCWLQTVSWCCLTMQTSISKTTIFIPTSDIGWSTSNQMSGCYL